MIIMRNQQALSSSHVPDPSNHDQINETVTPNNWGGASFSTSRDEDTNNKQTGRGFCNKRENLLTYLLLGVMPFCYGATTRLPFIYFVIHLSVHFELSWWTIGLCVGAYQGCRVIINIGQIFAPKSSHFLGQTVGFAGYFTVFLCDKDRVGPFIIGTAVIGLSETMACMQCYTKEMFKNDPDRKKTQRMMKYQYAFVMTGVMFAFCAGGVIYQYYSIRGVAMLGMLVTGTGWSALVCYLEIMRRKTAAPDASLVDSTPVAESARPSVEPNLVTGGFQTTSFEKTDRTCEDDDSSRCCEGQWTEQDVVIEFHPEGVDDEDPQESAKVDDIEIGGVLSKANDSSDPLFDVDTLKVLQDLTSEPTRTNKAIEPSPQDGDIDQVPSSISEVLVEEGRGADAKSMALSLPSSSMPPTAEKSFVCGEDEKTEEEEEAVMAAEGDVQEDCFVEGFLLRSKSDNELLINEESKSVSSDSPSDITEDEEEISMEGNNQADCIKEQSWPDESPLPREESKSPILESESNKEEATLGLETGIDEGEGGDVDELSLYPGFETAATPDARTMMMSMVRHADSNYHAADLPATWLNYLVCASFGIEALTIGYNLSIGPIFILNEFEVETGITGFLFAIGAGIGAVVAIVVTCTEWGTSTLSKVAKSPFDLCIAMGGIALGVFIAAIPNFPIHVLGLILLMAFNDIGCTLLTEFQGSITTASTFSTLGPLGQVARRSLNVVTAVSGPILYGIFRPLPYLVAGTITSLWVIMLVVAFKFRSKRTTANLAKEFGRSQGSLRSLMSFQTREVIRSCNDSKMFSIAEASTNMFSLSENCEV